MNSALIDRHENKFSKMSELVKMTQLGQNLYELIRHGNLVVCPDEELRGYISHPVKVEGNRGWRLSNTRREHKIDKLRQVWVLGLLLKSSHNRFEY